MSFYDFGNVPINSTYAPVNNPSTTVLLAELDSSNFGPGVTKKQHRTYGLNIHVGGSTGGYWVCETATSTALNSAVDQLFLRTASGQTSQFVWKVRLTNATDRIRVRHVSSVTGVFEAKLAAEELT